MKYLIPLTFLLSGCFSDTSDIEAHIQMVKNNASSVIQPMPAVPVFDHFDYSAHALRSPFDIPRPEAIQEKMQQTKGCVSPNIQREKQSLERFALSDLMMRGTLGKRSELWALIQASDQSLHRVGVGSYVGLYNGRITFVAPNHVKVNELIPDGAGCWITRETVISMMTDK